MAGIPMVGLQERRQELERSLETALAVGPQAVVQQVRCILALSETVPALPAPDGSEVVVTPAESRLMLLARLSEALSPRQVNQLADEAHALDSSAGRFETLLLLAPHLPAHKQQTILTEVWLESQKLADPASRARLLFRLSPLLSIAPDEPASPVVLSSLVEAAQSFAHDEARIRAQTAIIQHAPQALRVRLLVRVLDEIDRMPGGRLRASSITALAEHIPVEAEARALASAEAIGTPADRAQALIALASYLSPERQTRLRAAALEAIQAIASEEERFLALAAFVPLLEDVTDKRELTTLQERIQTSATRINRNPWRAKALAALARHLTPESFDLALSSITSTGNEHDRALLLAELAPHLPAEKLADCLDIARGMPSAEARIPALIALSRFAPTTLRQQIVGEVLAQIPGVTHPFEQVSILAALIEILPAELHDEILATALADVTGIENEHTRVRALILLGTRLSAMLLPRALEVANQCSDPGLRMSALSSLVPLMDDQARQDALVQLLQSALEIQKEFKRARALVTIAPLLSPEMLIQIQAAAEALTDPFDRGIVYIALAQNLPPDQRSPIIGHAWTLIKQIENGYDASSAITAIAPYLSDSMRSELIEAAREAIGAIRDEYDRASAIVMLAPLLLDDDEQVIGPASPDGYAALEAGLMTALDVPDKQLRNLILEEGAEIWAADNSSEHRYRLWRIVARRLAHMPLVDARLCLGALLPAMRALVGKAGMADIARSLLMR